MARRATPRYPVSALGLNNCELARRTGFSTRSFCRWIRDGIPLYQADTIAVTLGLHPISVWPDWGQALDSDPPFADT